MLPHACGHFICDDEYDALHEGYDSYVLVFVKSGRGFVYSQNQKIILSEGYGFLQNCNARHHYGACRGSRFEIYWIHFNGALVRHYSKAICRHEYCSIIKPRYAGSIFDNILNIYKQFHLARSVNDILCNKYLIAILSEFLLEKNPVREPGKIISRDLLAYIADNIREPLDLNHLASKAALSPYHFLRCFKKETGYTPHKYVLDVRINTAKQYLKNTAMSVKEIAAKCGFSSESSFCITFRHVTGFSPGEFRGSSRSEKTGI
jgi:AraC-like DNA-binding protein